LAKKPGIHFLERITMKLKRIFLCGLVSATLFGGGILLAQKPERDINPHHHPNLAAAQRLCDEAFRKVTAAQEANEWDMNGHAAKAKELLDQVNHELKLAAEAANKNGK
jgi:hypothetical protein